LARAAIFRIDFAVAPRGVCATSDRNNATTTITIITTASAGPNDILKDIKKPRDKKNRYNTWRKTQKIAKMLLISIGKNL